TSPTRTALASGAANAAPDLAKDRTPGWRLAGLIAVLTLALFVVAGLGLSIGSGRIPLTEVWGITAHRVLPAGWIGPPWADLTAGTSDQSWSDVAARIIADVRLPRVILAAIVGMSLTVVGTIVQAVMRNPLAGPTILGVSSGAATGAVVVMRFGLIVMGVFT